jgi:ABC-type sugar transport system ATPase subunit
MFIGSPPMYLLRGRIIFEGGAAFALEGQGAGHPLPGSPLPAGVAPGRAVVLGIRPEGMRLLPADADGWPAMVEELEPLGSETIVGLRMADLALTARVEGGMARVGRGDAVKWMPAPQALHWFDGESGRRLG